MVPNRPWPCRKDSRPTSSRPSAEILNGPHCGFQAVLGRMDEDGVDWSDKLKEMFDRTYLRPLAQIFSSPNIRAMAELRLPVAMGRLIEDSGLRASIPGRHTNSLILETIYGLLERHYRCEYVYKNTIAQKILLGRHRLAGATMATELRCGMSKADFAILNGTSTVYEIKTELDNLDRLPSQLDAYRNMFDKVFVVAHHGLAETLLDSLGSDVGILAMTKQGTLRQLRASESHAKTVNPACIFDSLRKSEYMPIVQRYFGPIPAMPNTRHYPYCKELFTTLRPATAHLEMVGALKHRFCPSVDKEFLKTIPGPLIAGLFAAKLSENQAKSIAKFMGLEYALF